MARHVHCTSRSYSGPKSTSRKRSQAWWRLPAGATSVSPGSVDRCHKFTRHPWRTSSPIRSRLGFWYTQEFEAGRQAHHLRDSHPEQRWPPGHSPCARARHQPKGETTSKKNSMSSVIEVLPLFERQICGRIKSRTAGDRRPRPNLRCSRLHPRA